MAKRTRSADIYLRFLQLTDASGKKMLLPPLDALEERILIVIAKSDWSQHRLSVRDLVFMEELASPATLHARLTSMRKKGWVTLMETDDARRKQIALTPATLRHFNQLSKCLLQAVREAKQQPAQDTD